MVQIVLSLFLIAHTAFSKTTIVQKGKRAPNYLSCTSPNCEKMNLHYANLVQAKLALEQYLKKSGQKLAPPAKISQQERLWNAQQDIVYQFVCDFNFDRAPQTERKAFLKFTRDSHKKMDNSLPRLEMAQCFYEVVQNHSTTTQKIMSSLGGSKTFEELLNQGKPSMDP